MASIVGITKVNLNIGEYYIEMISLRSVFVYATDTVGPDTVVSAVVYDTIGGGYTYINPNDNQLREPNVAELAIIAGT